MSYNTHVIPSAFRCITSKILSVRLFCALDTSLVLLRVILQDFLFDIFLWWKRALILCDQYLTIIQFVIGYNLPVCRLCGFQQSSRVLFYHFRAISHPPRQVLDRKYESTYLECRVQELRASVTKGHEEVSRCKLSKRECNGQSSAQFLHKAKNYNDLNFL